MMGEFDLPILSRAKSPKAASPPKSTPLQSIKREQDEIQLPLHTIPQASFAMGVEQQPGAAQFVPDDVEIVRFESTAVSDRSTPLIDMDIDGEVEDQHQEGDPGQQGCCRLPEEIQGEISAT
jgi:hypothetical protein